MTTFQKAIVATIVAAAIGTGLYETHRAATFQSQSTALQTERDSLAKQLQQQHDDFARQLATAARSNNPAAPGDVAEIAKLRAQVDRLHDQLAHALATQQNPATAQAAAWIDRVQKLKDKLAQSPNLGIPEFQYLTDQDWLDAVKNVQQLDSQDDYDKAIRNLQNAARNDFRNAISGAIHAYLTANPNSQPADFSQLQPYFAQAPDPSVLQDYTFAEPGAVLSRSASLVDAAGDYSYYNFKIGPDGMGGTTITQDDLRGPIQSYLAANNNQPLTDPSQLLPYVNTPDEKTSLQKAIQSFKPQ